MPKKRKGRGGKASGRAAKVPEAAKSAPEPEVEEDVKEHSAELEVPDLSDTVEIMMLDDSTSNDGLGNGEYDIKDDSVYDLEQQMSQKMSSSEFDFEEEIPVFKFEKFGAEELHEKVQKIKLEPVEEVKVEAAEEKKAEAVEEMETDVSSSLPEATSTTPENHSKESTPNIRRSTRIKSISKTKQRSHGHGLVRDKEKFLPKATPEEAKPMKVKSRWRHSAEIEQKLSEALPEVEVKAEKGPEEAQEKKEELEKARKEELEQKLKQFLPIRDNIYQCERNVSKDAKKMLCDCFLTPEDMDRGELGCGEDCLNRLLMIECGSKCVVGDRCTNRRFQKYQYSPCRVFNTEKKGLGIMATDTILAGDFVMEYVGEVLNSKQFEVRAANYSKDKNIHYYFMALRSDAVIDATVKGNISRFINHSCDPNAETQKWTVNGELRIGFFATRSIAPGEEITFDYQYQRYGKEAQKCFCEADNCRGWIGEEPDSTDEEEDEEDADDEGSEAEGSAGEADEAEKMPQEAKVPTKPRRKEPKPRTPAVRKTPVRRRRAGKKKRPEILDDPDLDDEIDLLTVTGLKNQAHTLKLSRLMVRAKVLEARRRLLNLLRYGEFPCRRLFLDYHGLRLLSGWMADGAAAESVSFRLELLETLKTLPISNKTVLKETGVLGSVEKWMGLADATPPTDSPSDKSTESPPSESSAAQTPQETPQEQPQEPPLHEVSQETVQASNQEGVAQEKQQPAETVQETTPALPPVPVEDTEALNVSIKDLGKSLLEKWLSLPEVFRIPKKERIEQMKEHEREADLKYMALGLHMDDEARGEENRSNARYKNAKEEPRKIPTEVKRDRVEDQWMSKAQRRRLFAMQAAEQMAVRRRMDEWAHHEFRCSYFGLDPYATPSEDIPSWVDPETGQWFAYDLTEVETPKSYAHIPAPQRPTSINIEDYDLPQLDLPEGWEYALDTKGQIYYYHRKIRICQWETPIRILPLGEQEAARAGSGSEMIEGADEGGDSSTTDTCDSEEEALEKRIARIKSLQKMGIAASVIAKLNLCDPDSEEEMEKPDGEERPGEAARIRCRTRLAEYREISPRREEDKLYSQMEMKRYRETKEKLRRRKEALRKRKLTPGADGVSEEEDKESEEAKKTEDSSAVCDSTSDLLIEKIVLGNSRVDELDEPLMRGERGKQKMQRKKRHLRHKLKSVKKLKTDNPVVDPQDANVLAKKIKDQFKLNIASCIVQHLNPYRKDTCTVGRITNNDDFKHLARKLSHFVMLKELKHCNNVTELTVTESVKQKSREFIRKYMAKFGEIYVKPENEPEYKD
ncbi:probable histone-lysine N-methyltransferase CG1716 isoform X2 [Phlebotomus argentipes]|uniref:probable histone-lysine N-methyltransferase CG1716 isoform X2 n=1 Tax=Phlebotomus argentipes TaxID=94469 RepID=UPI002892FD7B|nr:probable histone-lysine N-methyltransferase CG1716 isoform X2 [Phlebotomus argentipes]